MGTKSFAQTPGLIYKPATGVGQAVLDPNGDGYVSATSSGFSGSDHGAQSELKMIAIPQLSIEPHSDINTGSAGGHTDIVDDATRKAVFVLSDGTNLIIRFRIGRASTAAKGYSVLLDTDNTFSGSGNNPGFEQEVVLETGKRVVIYNHTNTTFVEYDLEQHHQRSVAYTTNNSDADYFYDFYVPLSGLSSNPVRFAATTITSASSGITGTISDVGGVNDLAYGGNVLAMLNNVITSFPPTELSSLTEGGTFAPVKSSAPYISGSISTTTTTISGTSTEPDGTTITVYEDGVSIGTTTVTGNAWSLSGISGGTLTAGSTITAKAQDIPGGKSLSDASNSIVVGQVCTTPPTLGTTTNGNKGWNGTWTAGSAAITGSQIRIYLHHLSTTGVVTTHTTNASGVAVYVPATAANTTSAIWEFILSGTGNSIADGTYWATATDVVNGRCESVPSNTGFRTVTATTAPVITSTPLYNTDNIVSGTKVANAAIYLYINGVQVSTLAATASTSWSVSGLTLAVGDVVTAKALVSGSGLSVVSNSVTVQQVVSGTSDAPVITGTYTNTQTAVSGTSTEAAGTVISVYKAGSTLLGTTTVTVFGTWTLTGITLATNDVLTAKAQATGENQSLASNSVTVTGRTALAPTVTSPILAGATSIGGGSGSGTLTVYIDGSPISPTLSSQSGAWTYTTTNLATLASELYKGAKVKATNTAAGQLESNFSNEVTVQGVDNFLIEAAATGNIGTQTAGVAFPVRIVARDAGNATFTTYTGTNVISSGSTIFAGSGPTVAFTAGILSTHNITLTKAGTYSLTTVGTADPSVTGTSNTFVINPGSASVLTIFQQPSTNATSSVAFAQQPVIYIYDAYGNHKTNDNSTQVTVAIASGTGTLNGTLTVPAVNGVVTYSGLSITGSGSYTLSFNSTGLTGVTSTSITLPNAPIITSNGGGSTAALSIAENTTAVTTVTATDADGTTPTYALNGGADTAKFTINATTGALTFIAAPDYENPADADSNNTYIVTVQATDGTNTDDQTITVTVTDVTEVSTFIIDAIANTSVAENAVYTSVTPSITGTPIGSVTYTLGGTDAADFTINSTTGVVSMIARNYESPDDADTDNIYELTITATDSDNNSDSEDWTVTVTDVTEASSFTIDAIANTSVAENAVYTSVTPSITGTPISSVTYTLGGTDAAGFTINSATGVVSMIARNYESPADANTDNIYELTITATDSDNNSDSEDWTVTVTDVTEASNFTIDAIANTSVAENAAYTSVTPSITGSPIGSVTYTLGGTDAADFTINSTTGVVSMIARNYESPADANTDNIYELTITATDADNNSDSEDWMVTITNENESSPVITSNSGGSTAAISIAENTTAVTTVAATDADGTTPTYALNGGADAAKFTINATTGVLTFISAPDYENPTDADGNNTYIVTVQATDGTNTDEQTITITVTDVTEVATFTIDAIANTSVAENAAYTSVTPSITGTPIGSVTYTLGGTDAADFTINSTTGVVSMIARNYESPDDADTDNIYELTITATDSDNNSDSEDWTVTITNENESSPVITSNSGGSTAAISIAENTTAVTTVAATDADGTTPTYALNGGADAAKFTINATTGALTFISAPDYENPADADGNNTYIVTVRATDGTNTDDQAITVTITNENESSPVITSNSGGSTAAISIAENTTAVTTVAATDADGTTPTYALNGGADAAKFTINATTGALTFIAAPDYENPADADGNNTYIVTVQATDGTNTDDQTITVTITNEVDNSITIKAANDTKVYGTTKSFNSNGSNVSITEGSLVGGHTITEASLTSPGAINTAIVAGSPYTISITPGTLVIKDGSNNDVTSSYEITLETGTLSVTAKALTISSATANNKVYDGTTAATISGTLTGTVGSDDVNFNGTGTFNTSSAGTGKAVTSTSTLTGSDAGNYTLTQPAGLTADITAAPLTITANDQSKTYGIALTLGTTAFTPSGLIPGETIGSMTLNSSGVAAGAAVAGSPYIITPSAATGGTFTASNYSISYVNGSLTVTAKGLTVTGATANNKVYDATTAATISGTLSGVETGDAVTFNGTGTFASSSAGTNIAVTSSSTITGSDAGNYTLTQPTGLTADITAAPLTVSLTGAVSKEYDGNTSASLASGNYILNGVLAGDAGNVALNNPTSGSYDTKNAGTGKTVSVSGLSISGSASGNYTLSSTTASVSIGTITAKMLTPTITASNKTYDGTTTATIASRTLSATIGSEEVILTGGSATFATASAGAGKTVTATGLSLTGADASNYTLSSTDATTTADITAKVLTPTITASDKTYDGTTSATISSRTLSAAIGSEEVLLTGGSATFATASAGTGKTVTATGLSLTGADASNYTLSSTGATTTADITPAPLTVSLTGTVSKEYDGNTSASLASGNYILNGVLAGDAGNVALNNPTSGNYDTKNAGTGKTVSVSGLSISGSASGNYTLSSTTASGSIGTITAKVLTPTITASNKVYDGTTTATIASRTLSTTIGSEEVILTSGTATFATASAGAGKTVTATGLSLTGADASNYTLSSTDATTTADITAKVLTPTITASNKTYDGTTSATISSRTLSAAIGSEEVILTGGSATFATASAGAGKTVTATGLSLTGADASNYTLSSTDATTTADITAKVLTPTITASDKTYDGTTSATISSRTLSAAIGSEEVLLTGGSATFATASAGTGKTVTATGLSLTGADASNYTLSSTDATTTADISARAITITANNASKVYGAVKTFTGSEYSISAGSLVSGDAITGLTISSSGSPASAGAGTYAITASSVQGISTSNYAVTYTDGTLTVNKASLTITADNKSKVYGAVNPDLTVTYSGFVTGDDASDLSGSYTISTTADINSVAGTNYPITVSSGTLSSANYAFTFVNGTLSVTKPIITVTAVNKSKTYGAVNPGFSVSYDGFENGETLGTSDVSGAPSLTTTATTSSAVGTYTITAGAGTLSSTNYDFVFVDGTLTINPATLTVTATGPAKTYGTALSAGSAGSNYTATGTISGETVTGVTLTPDAAGLSATTAAGSLYSVTPSAATGSGGFLEANYTITYVPYTGTVTAKALTISSATANNKVYDGTTAATISGTLTGTVGSDDVNFNGTGTFNTSSAGTGKAVTSTSTLTGSDAGNYTLTQPAGLTADITTAPLTVSLTGTVSKEYDGNTSASLASGNYILNGVLAGDAGNVVLNNPTSGSYDTKNAGTGKTVSVSGLSISGSASGNYTLSSTTASGSIGTITAKVLTPTITASDKTYDGTTTATIASRTLSTTIGSEEVILTGGTATFATASAGAGKTVTATGLSLTGADASNYTLSSTGATTTADITAAPLTVSLTGTVSKEYDGNTSASLASGNYILNGVLAGDAGNVALNNPTSGSYDTKNAGTGKTVSVSGLSISGSASGNYTLSSTTASGSIGTITAKVLTPTITASDKTYDGTTTATIASRTLSAAIGSEEVLLTGGSATFATASAGTGKTVTATGLSLTGADASNYTLSSTGATTTADITAAPLTVSLTGTVSKEYDGNTSASLASGNYILNGVLAGDAGNVILNNPTSGSYDTKNAGTGKTVSVSGLSISGSASGNYTLSSTTASGSIGTITAKMLTPTITASNKTYDGTTTATIASRTLSTTIGSEEVILTGGTATFATASAGAGKTVTATGLSLTGADASNYTLSSTDATTTADISARAITITANNASKIYGAVKTFTGSEYSISSGSLVSGDAITGLTISSSGSPASAGAGTYAITASSVQGINTDNYSVTFIDGTLTINKTELLITANDHIKTYDKVAYSAGNGVSYSGFVNNDNELNSLTGSLTYSGTSQGAINANTYTIIPGGYSAVNYNISYVGGILTINKAPLTIIAKDHGKAYDNIPYSGGNGVLYNGFINGDTEANSITGTLTFGGTSSGAKAIGTYTIIPSGLVSDNYSITFINGALTISAPLNTAPIAIADSYTVNEGAILTVAATNGLLANDTDSDNDVLTASLISTATNGTLTLNPDGSFTYVHNGSNTTSDSFTYKVNDGTIDGNIITVSIIVNPFNDSPIANSDALTTSEDSPVTVNLTNNDSDSDGTLNLTSIGITSAPLHGTLTLNTNGTVVYSPAQDYFGVDSFTYTIKDNEGKISNNASVNITVLSVNDAPVAINDSGVATQDQSLTINITANDTDIDGTINPSSITVTNSTTNGSLMVNVDGTVTYTPNVNFNGTDSFSYTIKDNNGQSSNIATVAITINKVVKQLSGGKIANDQSLCNNTAAQPIIEVTSASGDEGGYIYQWQQSIVDAASGFTNILNATNVNYTPGILTQTTWFKRVVNSTTSSASAESNVVQILVAPAIVNNTLTYSGSTTTYCGTGDPDKISGSIPTGGAGSTFSYQWQLSTDNVSYSNITGATGKDYDPGVISVSTYFRRRVTSGTCSAVSSNVVLITIQPALINNVIGSNQSITSGAIPEMLKGTLPSGGNGGITYLWESKSSGSSEFDPADGINTNMEYAPAAIFNTTLFRRKIVSGTCVNYSNTIQITVTNVNNSPVVVADSFNAFENTNFVVPAPGLLNNDSDPDNDQLTASVVSQPANGTVTVNADGGFIYTPKLNFTGTDSFDYQACDNGSPSLCQTGTVTIQVSGHPLIGLAKAGTDPVMKTDGSYDITYTLTVKNMGNVELSQVQVVDDLEKAFPAPLKFKVVSAPVVNGGLSGNILFNGNGDKNLLSSNSTLPKAGTATISFTVNVELAGAVGTYFNSATASGTGQGITVTDASTPGNNPDPNNNGNPGDPSEGGATETVLHGNAVLGIAKLVGTPIKQTDRSNLVTYSITVKNYGNVPLQNVQVTDDLSKTFPVPLQFSVEGAPKISSGILTPNLSFNGMGNNNLLAAGTILGVGQVDTIKITVKVIPDESNYGPFNNIAVGTAQTAAGAQTTDISTSGKDPDPDKNGIPDEKVETGVMLEKSTIKAPEGFSPNGDGVNDGFVIENLDGERISLEIYNRWGNMIYKDSDYKNTWNGICNQGIYTGKDIPDGTYYYIVSKKDGKDKYIGFLTINR